MYCVGVQPFTAHAADDRRAFYMTVAQLIAVGACRPCEIVSSRYYARCNGIAKEGRRCFSLRAGRVEEAAC